MGYSAEPPPPPSQSAEPARRSRASWSHTVRADEYEEFDQDAYVPMPRQEPYRPIRLVPARPSHGEPVRVVEQYWAEPRPGRMLSLGHHCVVRMSIGQRSFRVTLDTGAARSLARTSFVPQLRRFPLTKWAVGESESIHPISGEGVVKGMLTKPMTQITPIQLTIKEVGQGLLRPPKLGSYQERRVVEFVELEGAAMRSSLGSLIWSPGDLVSRVTMTATCMRVSPRWGSRS